MKDARGCAATTMTPKERNGTLSKITSGTGNHGPVHAVSVSVAHAQSTAPTISTVAITSSPGTDNTYATGDTITVSLTFSEAVTVTRPTGRRTSRSISAGGPALRLLLRRREQRHGADPVQLHSPGALAPGHQRGVGGCQQLERSTAGPSRPPTTPPTPPSPTRPCPSPITRSPPAANSWWGWRRSASR